MLRAVADTWDAVELWITQLAFPFQVVLAIVVVLPVCAGAAVAIDVAAGRLARHLAAVRRPPPPDGP